MIKEIIKKSRVLNLMPDKLYLKLFFYRSMKSKLDLKNPRTFNEKIQWLKLYDRNPCYTSLSDKYQVRKYVSKVIGDDYLIPLLGIWNSFEEIDFDKLPSQFVLKCTHDSGGIVICKDKSKFDIEKARKKINESLGRNYYHIGREWPYKNIQPRVICEKYMVDETELELRDYKFMCFNGEPKLIQVMSNRSGSSYNINHYDLNWKAYKLERRSHESHSKEISKPEKLNEMVEISRKLSKGLPFSRIDLYYVDKRIYFGEITLYPTSGFMDFKETKDDYLLGSWVELPNKKAKARSI